MKMAEMPSRRRLLQSGAAGAVLAALGQRSWSQAESGSLDIVKVVSGFPPGSSSDTTCRNIADRLAKDGYAKVGIVENKTGAAGQIAVQYVKTQAPDGRTVLQTPMSMLGIYPHTYKKLPYDPVADLTPVSLGCTFDFGLAIGPSVAERVKTTPDLLDWFKSEPSRASFGSPAAGSVPHFIGILLGRAGAIELTHVAYRGTQPAVQDVLGGQLPAAIGPVGDILRFRGPRGYRVLATTGATRSPLAPEVPTLVEQGYRELIFSEWYGLFMPPGASANVLNKLNGALRIALAHAETVKAFAVMGMEAKSSSPQDLGELLKKDTARWGPIIKSIGFTAES
jgi:tripartite-type tricarboxylate transporter receptor subunit TctC